MIQTDKSSWRLALTQIRGSSLQSIAPVILGNMLLSALVVAGVRAGHIDHGLPFLPFSVIGVAISIFLGFRNNACYDRFWEGRKLWGGLVNTSRTLTRQLLTLIGPESGSHAVEAADQDVRHFQERMVHHVMGYVHSLRHHLRGTSPLDDLTPFLTEAERESLKGEKNIPVAILQMMGDELADAWRRGWIHPFHLPVLEEQLTQITNIQGACERIKKTPIPMSYTILTHRIVTIYAFTLPFALVESTGWITPVATGLVTFAFFGLDAIGSQIEDPFGTDVNDLPLSALCTTIEQNLRQRLGHTELPPDSTPIDDVLS